MKGKIQQLVDEYGQINDKIKELEEVKKKLKVSLEAEGAVEAGTYAGLIYELNVIISSTPVLDVKKVMKKLSGSEFLKVISVSIEKVKEYLAPKDIDACTIDIKTTTRYVAKKIKK